MDNLKKSKSFLDIIREEVNKTNAKSNDFKTSTHEDLLVNEIDTDMSIDNGFRVPNDGDLFDSEINNDKSYSASASDNGFKIPNDEDLLGNEIGTDMSINNGFRVPSDSDLFENEINNDKKSDSLGSYYSKEDVQRYLNTIISSTSDYDMSEYMNVSSGTSIVGIDELNDMIMDGYTITKAECLSVNPSMISIVYNKIIKKSEIGKRR